MKRFTVVLLPVFAVAFTATAFAQGDKPVVAAAEDTMKVTVSGGLDMDYVYRQAELLETDDALGGGAFGLPDTPDAEGTYNETGSVEGRVHVRLDVELNKSMVASAIGMAKPCGC